jgi:hypothetical protein
MYYDRELMIVRRIALVIVIVSIVSIGMNIVGFIGL